jgi:uncharacterized protein (UPF0276 family)
VTAVSVGITLPPHEPTLARLERSIFELAEHWEVTPETLWRPRSDGRIEPNGFHALFRGWRERARKPVLAHGVGFSVGSPAVEWDRRGAWLAQLRRDAADFGFPWLTEHLGATRLAGLELTLPLPLPMTAAAAAAVRASLDELRVVVPDVGLENSVFYFHLGSPLREPDFLRACLDAPRSHLLLDLHNVLTTAVNAGFDPWRYVERLPLERVVEIHLSGGANSEPGWLPSGATRRLDSHDHDVPEEVWSLLERALPLCPNVKAVTLERMESTVEDGDVPRIEDELRRARRVAELGRG